MSFTDAVSALQQKFADEQIALRGSDHFNTLNGSYLSRLECDIEPACIVLPRTKEEVIKFVQTIKPFIDNKQIAFAIRARGQQPAPGCANIQDGVTLDLRLLTGVQVRHGCVSVAAGECWHNVYKAVQKEGLATSGSRAGTGGIGGLALTGGLSFFSSREGFVCDNIINYEVVIPSGRIINVNAKENADLWLALRGGGNNFGIVTSCDVRTFKQGPFWGGSIYYFPESFPGQIEALVTELRKPDASEETHLMLSVGYAAAFGQTMGQNQIYYTQPAEETPAILHPFTNIEPQLHQLNSMRKMDLVSAASEQSADTPPPQRCSYMNCVVKADVATLLAASGYYQKALDTVKHCDSLICAFTLQPYAISLLKKSSALGGNSFGLDPSAGPLVNVLLLTYWKERTDDETITTTMKDVLEAIKQDSARRGTLIDYTFMNYAFTHQDPIGSYGAENKKKLQEVSKKYDPEGMFQTGVPGGWKLFP